MPILLVSGYDDPLGDYGKGIVQNWQICVESWH